MAIRFSRTHLGYWLQKIKQNSYQLDCIISLLLRIMDQLKPNCSLFSTFKKTRATFNADSSGQKDFKKVDSDRNLHNAGESFAYLNKKRRIQFSQTKLSLCPVKHKPQNETSRELTNPQRKYSQPQQKWKQSSVDEILSKSLKLAKACYQGEGKLAEVAISQASQTKILNFNRNFKNKIISVIKEIKYKSKELACNLNTIYFLSQNVQFQNLTFIEKQIFKHWRENSLLKQIKSQWMLCLQEFLPTLDSDGLTVFSLVIYQDFCFFMSHLTYLIFQVFYTHNVTILGLDRKQIIHRLNTKTMRYIVTQSSQWQNIIYLHIEQLLLTRSKCETITSEIRQKLNKIFLNEMIVAPLRELLEKLYMKSQRLFPCTQEAISRMLKEHYIPAKIKRVLGVRVALEQDVLQYQKILLDQGKIEQLDMLEKDPMLTALFLGVIGSGISLTDIDLALREIKLILGQEYMEILNIEQCPSYFVDLVAVIDQLNLEVKLVAKQLSKSNIAEQ